MKPMSAEAVKRLALAHGGTAQIDGRQVNAARLQVAAGAIKPQRAEPDSAYMRSTTPPAPVQTIESKPDPAVKEAILSIDQYAASQFLINESNMKLMQTVQETLQKVADRPAEQRPTQWVFKVKRDAQGLMETITATAK